MSQWLVLISNIFLDLNFVSLVGKYCCVDLIVTAKPLTGLAIVLTNCHFSKQIKSFDNSNKQMDVYNLAVTSLLVILIFAVYHNNQDIGKINSSAKSANQVLEKSEVNDVYFFKSNNQIMNYLKARDGMKKELDKLKLEVKNNSKKNIDQDHRLEQSDMIDKEQNRIMEVIKKTYKSDVNFLVNMSLTETQKHLPNEDNAENLKKYRELLYFYVLEMFMGYSDLFPKTKLDDFLDEYAQDVSFILAESIYEFNIYNYSQSFPKTLLLTKQIQKELQDDAKVSFFIKTYFPRMLSFIKSNQRRLFYEFEAILASRMENTRKLFSPDLKSVYATFVLKDVNIDIQSIDKAVLNYVLVQIPEFFTRALYYTSTNNQYIAELESKLISLPLYSCTLLEEFYKSWSNFNIVKKENMNLIPDTEKRKLLRDLIKNNPIFKNIYERRLKNYNDELHQLPDCMLPKLPTTFKEFYVESDIVFPTKEEEKNKV